MKFVAHTPLLIFKLSTVNKGSTDKSSWILQLRSIQLKKKAEAKWKKMPENKKRMDKRKQPRYQFKAAVQRHWTKMCEDEGFAVNLNMYAFSLLSNFNAQNFHFKSYSSRNFRF